MTSSGTRDKLTTISKYVKILHNANFYTDNSTQIWLTNFSVIIPTKERSFVDQFLEIMGTKHWVQSFGGEGGSTIEILTLTSTKQIAGSDFAGEEKQAFSVASFFHLDVSTEILIQREDFIVP